MHFEQYYDKVEKCLEKPLTFGTLTKIDDVIKFSLASRPQEVVIKFAIG